MNTILYGLSCTMEEVLSSGKDASYAQEGQHRVSVTHDVLHLLYQIRSDCQTFKCSAKAGSGSVGVGTDSWGVRTPKHPERGGMYNSLCAICALSG